MWSCIKYLVVVGVVALVCLELYFRFPGAPKIMNYSYHPERFYSLQPDQPNAHDMLGNFSVMSPSYRINAQGFRGADFDAQRPTIALVGSSDMLGVGVVEPATVAGQLQRSLGATAQVANLGVQGYGPQHHEQLVHWAFDNLNLQALVVRVSIEHRGFVIPGAQAFAARERSKERNAQVVKWLNSAPLLLGKAVNQVNAPRQSVEKFLAGFAPDEPDRHQQHAEITWSKFSANWQAITARASQVGVRVLFFLENGMNNPAETLLCQRLQHTVVPGVSAVMELGSAEFGLGDIPAAFLEKEFRTGYTLGFDPHGNPEQYAVIAQHLHQWLSGQREGACSY